MVEYAKHNSDQLLELYNVLINKQNFKEEAPRKILVSTRSKEVIWREKSGVDSARRKCKNKENA